MSIPTVLTRDDRALAETPIRLEFPLPVLVRLLAQGQLKAAEFRCLDLASQLQVRRALLISCLQTLNGERA